MAAFGGKFKNRTQEGDESIYKNRCLPRQDMRCLFVLLVTFTCCHGYQEQRFVMEPQDQSAILGSHVTLPCRVESKAGSLQWTKDDFGLGTHRNLSGYERYRMIGTDEEGDYSLDIRNITLEDDATYQCQVSSGLNGEPGIRSRSAQLTVLIAPDPPKITQGAFIDATEEKAVDIECVSMGGKPAAEITWVDGNQVVIKKGVESRTDLLSDGQRFITRSVLRLVPRKEYHNQSITCQAQNPADRAYRMATVHIEVKYAPKVKVFVKSEVDNEKIPEGDDAVIVCDVDANPLPKQYNWYINNKPVIGDYDREMLIFNVSRKLNGAIVECEVGNAVAVSSEKKVLEVTYPPFFKSRPKNMAAEDGATVTLNCDVDGYPQPEIRWLLYEPGRIGVKGKTASLKLKVTNATAGRYLCKASVDGYPEIEAQANVFIKGPPKILSNLTQFGMEGDMVTIECAALSVPKPDDISWFYNGREISVIHNQEYALIETPLTDGIVKTSLVIKSSQSKHFGLYNCSITNEYGNANEGILLKPHKTFPLIMILVAVTSVIVLLSFVILLIICIKRKRNKTKDGKEKSDVKGSNSDYKESDRSSNISDFKVPHGDGTYDLDYTSSSHTGSNLKLAGLPLAGPVSLPNIRHDDPLMQFRYSNDYTDPIFADAYLKAPGYLSYAEYTPDYPLPPGLRVQSPSNLDVANANRSLQGSLTRSIDTASTIPMSGTSQNNSLQRASAKPQDESETINHLGLPLDNEGPPIYAQPTTKGTLHNGGVLPSGLDVRFAATYGNPYLRANTGGFGAQGQAPKSSAAAAPPPYSARNSVVGQPGNNSQASQATHV